MSFATLVIFDSHLFAAGVKDETQANSNFCMLRNDAWNKIAQIPGRQLILVPCEDCIFILNKASAELYQIFPKDKNPNAEEFTKLPVNQSTTGYTFSEDDSYFQFCYRQW